MNNILFNTILPLVVSALVTGVVGYLVKRSLDKYFTKKDAEAEYYRAQITELEQLRADNSREERRKDLTEIIGNSVSPIEEKITSLHDKVDKNTSASVMLLRDAMKTDLLRCEDQGFATELDKFNWQELYDSYRACGGNHFKEMVNAWRDRMNALPTEKDSEDKN